MRSNLRLLILISLSFCFQSLIVRHDVPDEKFMEYAKSFPQLCHLPDGESTLIAPSWILTAAHVATGVVTALENEELWISCQKKNYPVEKVVLHPQYEFTPTRIVHDLALIKIDGQINDVTPAELYPHKDEAGKIISIVGRGDTGTGFTGPQKWDQITRAGTNRIDGTTTEWFHFDFDSPDSDNATTLESVSGPGDSGGPAFVDIRGRRFIVGVSSHQLNENGEGLYGVTEYYTRVSHYKSWIDEIISQDK